MRLLIRLDFVLGRSGLENTGTQRSNFYLPKIFSTISVLSLLTLLHHLFPWLQKSFYLFGKGVWKEDRSQSRITLYLNLHIKFYYTQSSKILVSPPFPQVPSLMSLFAASQLDHTLISKDSYWRKNAAYEANYSTLWGVVHEIQLFPTEQFSYMNMHLRHVESLLKFKLLDSIPRVSD